VKRRAGRSSEESGPGDETEYQPEKKRGSQTCCLHRVLGNTEGGGGEKGRVAQEGKGFFMGDMGGGTSHAI